MWERGSARAILALRRHAHDHEERVTMRPAIRFLTPLGTAAVLLAALAGDGPAPTARAQGLVEQSVEYTCTGRPEPFGVPPGVTQLTVEAEGAAGNERSGASRRVAGSGRAGRGGRVTGTLAVTPGTLVTVTVGCVNGYGDVPGGTGGEGTSHSGFNGGGASGIRDMRQGPFGVFVVAAGGGGGGGRSFSHATLAHGVTPFTLAASGITFFPIWGLVACPMPPSSSTVPCYDLATASAFGPSR
jgi:hypothetical protein